MGAVLSSVSELFFGAPTTDNRHTLTYSYPALDQSLGYPRSPPPSYRPSTNINTTNNTREESRSSYSRIVASSSAQSNRPSYNVAPAPPQRVHTLFDLNTDRIYSDTMNQCILECSWTPFQDEATFVRLQQHTREYNNIAMHFSKFLRRENPNIIKIDKVQNYILMGQYMLKKVEYQYKCINFQEKLCYHGTKGENVTGIARNNFNWRLAKHHLFGKGVSFAPKSSYAINYCDKNQNNTKVMFVAKVLTGNSCIGSKNLPLPHEGFDTTTKEDGNVIVKYYDNEFYPEYVIHFTATIIPRSNNRKYIY